MTSRGLRRSRSRSADSGKSGSHKSHDRPWLRNNRSNSRSRSRSTSRSRSSRGGRRTSKDGSRSSSPTRPVMSKDPKYVNARVFVANLASDITTTGELTKLFEKHGRILDTLVHHNGYGFVQFAREEEGRAAVASVNGTLFHGKKIKCNMAAEKRNKSTAGNDGPSTVGDNRFNRDRSPNREPFGSGFSDPFFGGRDLPPPRDPYFDDPYRRPVPPDPFFDRFREDPYRRDPYAMDLYRDPYRDPYPPPPPVYDTLGVRKPVHVDCEIIVLNMVLRDYAEMIEHRLKNLNILTSVVVIREDRTIQQQVEDATRRDCLFAVVINSQNEVHRSLTLNILHGLPQEHRNMPLDDALALVARSFDKYLQTEKEKAAAALSSSAKLPSVPFLPPAKEIAYLLNLLADNRQLTVDELNKVIVYLKERRDKLMEAEGIPPQNDQKVQESTSSQPPEQLLQQQQISQQQLLQQQQLQQQQQMSQQQQQMSQQQQQMSQQQLQQQQQMSQQQLQQQQQHQELQSKILSLMNGTSASVPTTLTVPKPVTGNLGDTLLTLTKSTSLKPLTQTVSPVLSQAAGLSMYQPHLVEAAAPAPAPAPVPSSAPALINFDNPTVQKALENLIQSGPNLLRNITIPKTVTQPAAPGSTGLFPSSSTHRPY